MATVPAATVPFPAVIPSSDPSVGEVIAQYLRLEAKSGSKAAWKERERVLGRFADHCGGLRLSECKKGHLKTWIDANKRLKSDWSKGRWCRAVQRVFNWAANDVELIDRNPFRGVRYRKGKRGRAVTETEFQAMVAAARPEVALILKFCRWTGARSGEMCKATWADIRGDLNAGAYISLDEHKTAHIEDTRPRIIALPPVVVEMLKTIARDRGHLQGAIFLNSKGRPWTNNSVADAFRALRKKLGFAEDCKFHGTRHAFATVGIINKLSVKDVADLLGHKTTRMAEHYIHAAEDYARLCELAAQATKIAQQAMSHDDFADAIC